MNDQYPTFAMSAPRIPKPQIKLIMYYINNAIVPNNWIAISN